MASLKPGDKAPAFSMESETGEKIALKDFKGKKLVLYFYPKDDTPGCTKEAIAFTEDIAKFRRAGAAVVGVSRDTVAKHEKFKDKHGLKVTLGSDEDGKVSEAYEVWVKKKNYGREYMGIERSTFLIDENGKIAEIWRRVRVNGHVEAVLAAVKAL